MVWKLIAGEEVALDDYHGIDAIGAAMVDKLMSAAELEFDATYGWMDFTAPSLGGN